MDIEYPKPVGELVQTSEGSLFASLIIGAGDGRRRIRVDLPKDGIITEAFWAAQQHQPLELPGLIGTGLWGFRGKVAFCSKIDAELLGPERLGLLIKHCVLQEEREWTRIERQVAAFENVNLSSQARRERIPDSVRLFVWQRDEAKCVRCGDSNKLEFDHIIPVAEGGSNTERNIQLLCETCNRSKGRQI